MVLSTIITRLTDHLPLAASVDAADVESQLEGTKRNLRVIISKLTPTSEPLCSIDSGAHAIHYLVSQDIVYLTITDKSFPRKFAFSYLDELQKEFERSFGEEARKPGLRPYAFVKFDGYMQKTKRLYQDSRTATANASGLDKLNEELQDVTRIMNKNMEDLLWRGDSLDRMSTLSSSLKDESLKYRKAARHINLQALYRKWAPVGVMTLLVCFVLWWRVG